MTVPLTEQDVADIRADIRVAEQALAEHENRMPLAHMTVAYGERTKMLKDHLADLERQLVDG